MRGIRSFFAKGLQRLDPKKIFQLAAVASSALALSAAGLFHFIEPEAEISNLKNTMYQPTLIFDHNAKLASSVTANKVETVPIKQVPDYIKDAVVAIEDHRFYKHGGIDYQGIFRAAIANIKAGGVVQGGSTITQQLTKNALLNSDRTYKRKLKEYFLAKEVEKKFTKDEIMEMYLNQIYFGHGAWGIKRASQIYFAKDVKDLSVSEGALLAGIVKAPADMDPFSNKQKALKRRDTVLGEMKKYGFINNDTYDKAKMEEIALNTKELQDPLKGKYPYFIDLVFDEAIKKYKLNQDELLTGGYRIYTTLDQKMQLAAENVYKNDAMFPKGTSNKPVQSGAVLLDPKTGGIRALVGGRGDHTFRGYNRATHLKTQPGSTMKPLAVYTPALEEGYKVTDELKDEKMDFGNYEPSNFHDEYKGKVPMYEAVIKSLNVPAVWLLNEIGITQGMNSAKKFGIPLTADDRKLGLALGGLTTGVSPLQMAEAYSVFPNNGDRVDAHAITKIVDAQGKEVARWEASKTKVTNKETAKKMTAMLKGVVEEGTGRAAAVTDWQIAGKTGSTQVPLEGIDGVKDQWFVGYSPVLVGAVWVGYDKTDKEHYLTTSSSEGAAPLFKELMSRALADIKPVSFHVKSIETYKKEERKRVRKRFWEEQKQHFKDGWKKWTDKLSQDGSTNSGRSEKATQHDGTKSNEKDLPASADQGKQQEKVNPKKDDENSVEPGRTGGEGGQNEGDAGTPPPPNEPPEDDPDSGASDPAEPPPPAEPQPDEPQPEDPAAEDPKPVNPESKESNHDKAESKEASNAEKNAKPIKKDP